MEVKMEGREPLLVLFGLPVLSVVLVVVLLRCACPTPNQPPNVHVDAKITATPEVTAKMEPAHIEIREIPKDRVQVPDVKIENRVETPQVKVENHVPQVAFKLEKSLPVHIDNLPSMFATTVPAEKEDEPFGKVLPPPKK